jgi:uncharacterized protein (DUF305 family)
MIVLVCILYATVQKSDYPCRQELSDDEFINHMITHHEVAVSMSENHLHTKNPIILEIVIRLIKLQKYEINLMKDSKMIKDEFDEMSDKNIKMDTSFRYTQGDFMKPNTPYLSNTFCNPSFFKMKHNTLHMTDEMYMQHMIPHHQVAVDMSKKILKTTKNDFIIDLAYKIIHNQQEEISKLYYLSKSKNMFESNIL